MYTWWCGNGADMMKGHVIPEAGEKNQLYMEQLPDIFGKWRSNIRTSHDIALRQSREPNQYSAFAWTSGTFITNLFFWFFAYSCYSTVCILSLTANLLILNADSLIELMFEISHLLFQSCLQSYFNWQQFFIQL